MHELINILIQRDGIDEEHARSLIKETCDEIMCNPNDVDTIIMDYLGLEPDYLEDLLTLM